MQNCCPTTHNKTLHLSFVQPRRVQVLLGGLTIEDCDISLFYLDYFIF